MKKTSEQTTDLINIIFLMISIPTAVIYHQQVTPKPPDQSYLTARITNADREIMLEGNGDAAKCWERLWNDSRQHTIYVRVDDPKEELQRLNLSTFEEKQRYLNLTSNSESPNCRKAHYTVITLIENRKTTHITKR